MASIPGAAGSRGIIRLDGLQFATNLQSLNLAGNALTDLRMPGLAFGGVELGSLVGIGQALPSLDTLALDNNKLSDLTGLAGFPALKRLSLDGNPVSDLSPLAGLTSLEFLSVDGATGAWPRRCSIPRETT